MANMSMSMHCLSVQSLVAEVLPPILILEFIVGLPVNLVALWIFSCRMQSWSCNTVYLLNLLIADFFLLVSLPFRIDTLMRREEWVYGDAMCRINLFMLAVNRSASIAFMTVVAVDRYFKVIHPHHPVSQLTKVQAGILSGMTWAVVLALRLPLLSIPLMQTPQHLNVSLCRSFSYGNPPPIIRLHYAVYLFEFFLPFLILIFCSLRIICFLRHRQTQRAKQAIKVVLLLVAVFTICFLPGVASGLTTLFIQKLRPDDCYSFNIAGQAFSLSIGFTYLNSTLDPFIYCLSSSMFRNALKASFNKMGIFHMQLTKRGSVASDE